MNIQDLFSAEELKLLQLRADRVAIPITEDEKTGRIAVLTTTIGKELLEHVGFVRDYQAMTLFAVYQSSS